MKAYLLGAVGLASLLALGTMAGCSGAAKTDCNDGIDNDGDGLIDEADPGCAFNMGRTEAPNPAQCNDGLDNDGDGLVDTADPGCMDGTDDDETDPIRACNNGMDDDGDALIDFPMDPGCDGPLDNDEFNPLACQDFIDNDGDGIIDYPFDPGCDAMTDNDETDPNPEPQCANGIDDDLDGATDYPMDPGCGSAGDNDEFNTIVGACGPSVVITDITGTGTAMATISMAMPNELSSPTCHGYGGEFAYTYSLTDGPKALLVTTDFPETTLDTVIYVRTNCRQDMTELGCNDDGGQGPMGEMMSVHGSTLLLPTVASGSYYIIVDAFGPGSLGNFKLSVTERNPLHGACDPADPTACIPGLICRAVTPGGPTTCEEHVCGDGVDNDGDGKIDYPVDPGCLSTVGDDETDPSPEPQCADLIDNDSDGLIDYPADPGCTAASDNLELDECFPGKTVAYLDPVLGVTDSTSAASDGTVGSCAGGATGSPENVYALTPTLPLNSITVSTDNAMTTFDTVVYVRADVCATGTEVACSNDVVPGVDTKSTATWTPIAGHTYYVFVDGTWTVSGPFHLSVSGVISPGGVCDPAIPAYACSSGYTCKESVPGAADFACRVALCNDGTDNDGDTRTDYPNDSGCATPSDDDETDPSPEPQCFNMIDDDADGFIDYPADLGCSSAADNNEVNDCVPGEPVIDHPGGTVTGDTTGGPSLLGGSCDTTGSSITTPERVYVYHLAHAAQSMKFSTAGSAIDTLLYVRTTDCSVAEPLAACNDNSGPGTSQSEVDFGASAPGYYYAIVDGLWSATGPISISITGVIAAGNACTIGDAAFPCALGYTCTGTCTPAVCNDGTDNDGDGLTDYPNDPGCTTPSTNSETDPVPEPACHNGADDDGDGFTDYPADVGCLAASDDDEVNDCVAGEPVIDHPGGTLAGDTTGAPSLLGAPATCDTSGSSSTTPERVYVFHLTTAVANLHFDTLGSSLDTVLYVRSPDCAVAGPSSWCDDDSGGLLQSVVDIPSPALGYYFAVVDGKWSGSAPFNLTIRGDLAPGAACVAGSTTFVCAVGATCSGGFCVPSLCNDGLDNDGDGHIDAADPGCADITDNTEAPDPSPLPQCANGIDDDGDGHIDYPSDPGCSRASDTAELDCEHDKCVTGVKMTSSCDTCVTSICASDSFCCVTSWDSICVGEVGSICGLTCP